MHAKFSVIGASAITKLLILITGQQDGEKTKTVLTGSNFTVAGACSGKAGDEVVSRTNIRMVKANEAASKILRISPETIYKTLYFRSREALHHLNVQHLRRSHSLHHGIRHTRRGERGTINIVNGTPIQEKNYDINNIIFIGHWEGDLVPGTKNSHIATLVDRKSRYTIILRLRGKDSV